MFRARRTGGTHRKENEMKIEEGAHVRVKGGPLAGQVMQVVKTEGNFVRFEDGSAVHRQLAEVVKAPEPEAPRVDDSERLLMVIERLRAAGESLAEVREWLESGDLLMSVNQVDGLQRVVDAVGAALAAGEGSWER
jgi:hypothetical protein